MQVPHPTPLKAKETAAGIGSRQREEKAKGSKQQAESREQQAQPKADPPLAEEGSRQRSKSRAQGADLKRGCKGIRNRKKHEEHVS